MRPSPPAPPLHARVADVCWRSLVAVTFALAVAAAPRVPFPLSEVTLTTVGYGDLSAHKPVTKLFACFYILVGVAMIAAFLGQLVELVLDKQVS